jgi:hypothetical protein
MAKIIGTDLEQSYREARDKLRGGLEVTDINSVDGKNIILGQGTLFTKEWNGTTGYITYEYIDGENRSEWAWFTGTFKTANILTDPPVINQEMGMLYQKEYQDIWGLSKSFYLEHPATVRVYVSADVIIPPMHAWSSIGRYSNLDYEGGYASQFYLEVDGTRIASTETHAWEDIFDSPLPTGEPDNGLIDSTLYEEPDETWIRRSLTMFYGETIFSAGDKTFKVVVDPRAERGYVSRRQIIIECTYK